MSSGDSNSPNRYDNLILDSSSQRLLELTSRSPHERSSEAIDELLSILQRKVPKLLDGLADSNKVQIGKQCKLKMYRKNDVVFLQGDEPDAYYTVIRGAVSIYFTKPDSTEPCSSVADCEDLASAEYTRDQYGVFLLQLPPGESFGELSFNENGVHSQRNASVISDGSHGQARISRNSTISNSNLVQPEVEASDVCILLLIPEKVYLDEMFARHAAKHQTKDKINFLKQCVLFNHWTMDQLVKMAYAMKKKHFDPGAEVVRQGERVEYCWLINEGVVRISHRVNASKGSKSKERSLYVDVSDDMPEQSITVDIADLRANDCIGLIESMDEQTRKSQRDAVTLCSAELYFLPMSFFRSIISHDATTFSLIEKVVKRRKKWEFIRREYALKFPTMAMSLPKGSSSLSHYAIRRNDVAAVKSRKKRDSKKEHNNDDTTVTENDDSKNALDSLVTNAGL